VEPSSQSGISFSLSKEGREITKRRETNGTSSTTGDTRESSQTSRGEGWLSRGAVPSRRTKKLGQKGRLFDVWGRAPGRRRRGVSFEVWGKKN